MGESTVTWSQSIANFTYIKFYYKRDKDCSDTQFSCYFDTSLLQSAVSTGTLLYHTNLFITVGLYESTAATTSSRYIQCVSNTSIKFSGSGPWYCIPTKICGVN